MPKGKGFKASMGGRGGRKSTLGAALSEGSSGGAAPMRSLPSSPRVSTGMMKDAINKKGR